ncbi:universal stress protein a [Trichococcus palustris]|jgi:nucleotide-binding universal stress UspA family protein|uniref:Universal stress protein n=1 Tax=Trichococcus palustris TaxID=140314 RepID=A0A143YML9_9LACT|nr:universal stress protein [Trichococcus palustris]CZQ91017.1 universal stress protein a [Trichococcus palustris]SFL03002.1 Nucleotide-binding universal stress protein, UspA family [Trichococcus palustris]
MLGEYKNILVPVDGSAQSEDSFKKAVAIAKRNNAVLHLVYIADTRNMSLNPENEFQTMEALKDLEYAFLDEMVAFAETEGVVIKKTAKDGNPMTLIAETFPKLFNADLIVIGATGKGAITRAFVGSVSNYVVRHAPCDVLVVRT